MTRKVIPKSGAIKRLLTGLSQPLSYSCQYILAEPCETEKGELVGRYTYLLENSQLAGNHKPQTANKKTQ
jgi:hypothetical protein